MLVQSARASGSSFASSAESGFGDSMSEWDSEEMTLGSPLGYAMREMRRPPGLGLPLLSSPSTPTPQARSRGARVGVMTPAMLDDAVFFGCTQLEEEEEDVARMVTL